MPVAKKVQARYNGWDSDPIRIILHDTALEHYAYTDLSTREAEELIGDLEKVVEGLRREENAVPQK